MKLKEFKQTMAWKVADCIEYYDENGVEIGLPTTGVARRKFDDREVITHRNMPDGDVATMEVVLK